MKTAEINASGKRPTKIARNGSINAIRATVCRESEHLVALEILIDNEECMVAAYGENKIPSIIVEGRESGKFTTFSFIEFERFEIWSADLSGDVLRVCLVK